MKDINFIILSNFKFGNNNTKGKRKNMKFIKKHPYLFCELLGVFAIIATILTTIVVSKNGGIINVVIGSYILYIAVIELIISPIIIKLVKIIRKKIENDGLFSKKEKNKIRRKHILTALAGIALVILGFEINHNALVEHQAASFYTWMDEEENTERETYVYASIAYKLLIKDGERIYQGKNRRYKSYSYYISEDNIGKDYIVLLPTDFKLSYSAKKIEGTTVKIDDKLKKRIIEAAKSNGMNITEEDFGNKISDIYFSATSKYTGKTNYKVALGMIIIGAGILFLILTIIDIVRIKKLES